MTPHFKFKSFLKFEILKINLDFRNGKTGYHQRLQVEVVLYHQRWNEGGQKSSGLWHGQQNQSQEIPCLALKSQLRAENQHKIFCDDNLDDSFHAWFWLDANVTF